jgi:hypothetical protein
VTAGTEQAAEWSGLRPSGVAAVPQLVEAYHRARTWEDRAAALMCVTRYARESEPAFQLGLGALGDRSKRVRYRACALLAYSLRRDAVARLEPLLDHPDCDTREDALAAVAAICARNHHLFMDRDRSDLVFWIVDEGDIPYP